jgi:hypothetical protein
LIDQKSKNLRISNRLFDLSPQVSDNQARMPQPPVVLKWSGSIASRGKFKGKTVPVLDQPDYSTISPSKHKVMKKRKKIKVQFVDNQTVATHGMNRRKAKEYDESHLMNMFLKKWDQAETLNDSAGKARSEPFSSNPSVLDGKTRLGNRTIKDSDPVSHELTGNYSLVSIQPKVPRMVYNKFDLQFTTFSYFITNIYTTNITSSCSHLLSRMLDVSRRDYKIMMLIDDLCNRLITTNHSIPSITNEEEMYTDNSIISIAESYFAAALLKHFIIVSKYGTAPISLQIKSAKEKYDENGGIALTLFNPDLIIWVKLNYWYDSIYSLMVGREPYFPKDDKDAIFKNQTEPYFLHNSDLYAIVGCTDDIASKLVDIAYIIGKYGLNAFDNSSSIDLDTWNQLEEILLFLHSWQTKSERYKLESDKAYNNRIILYEVWKWAALLYIYTVCYRKSSKTSFMVKSIRDKVLHSFSKFSDPMASKQALWTFFLAACEINLEEIDMHVWCLNLLENWYESTNLGCFKTHMDSMLEIWNLAKESNGEIKWWEILPNRYEIGKGEIVFS